MAAGPSSAIRMLKSSLKTTCRETRGPSSSSTINNVGLLCGCGTVEASPLNVVTDGSGNGMGFGTCGSGRGLVTRVPEHIDRGKLAELLSDAFLERVTHRVTSVVLV